MWVENPIRETAEEIERKYDGYCVLVTECDKDSINYTSGKVLAYHKKISDLSKGARSYINSNDVGFFMYRAFMDFGDSNSGIIDVIYDYFAGTKAFAVGNGKAVLSQRHFHNRYFKS